MTSPAGLFNSVGTREGFRWAIVELSLVRDREADLEAEIATLWLDASTCSDARNSRNPGRKSSSPSGTRGRK